jgi:hypothetical protein
MALPWMEFMLIKFPSVMAQAASRTSPSRNFVRPGAENRVLRHQITGVPESIFPG